MRPATAILAAVLGLAGTTEAHRAESGSARQAEAAPSGNVEADLWAILSPKATKGRLDESLLAAQIARIGSGVVRPAIAILLGESEEPEPGYEIDSRTIQARPRILLAALKKLRRADVLHAIDAVIRERDDTPRRLGLAKILSELGGEEGLRRILEISGEIEPIQLEGSFVQIPLQESIARLVRGNERLAIAVARCVRGSDPGLSVILTRGLSLAGAWQAAGELALALGRHPRLDLCLAESLATMSEAAAGTLPESVLALLRGQLDASDVGIVCAVAEALGRLGDASSAERLLRLADDPDARLRICANSALTALCGRDLPRAREARSAWLEREKKWSEERLPELELTLAEGDPRKLPGAIAELGSHRMFRHRAAFALIPMLGSERAEVARLACGVLPGFRSRSVVPALRALARNGEPGVREAAATALRAITGDGANPADTDPAAPPSAPAIDRKS